MGRQNSFANQVRNDIRTHGRKVPVKALEISARLDLGYGHKNNKPLYSALHDLTVMGDIERTAPGEYLWKGRKKPPTGQERMWSVLRSRRVVSLDDLVELAGVRKEYPYEFLRSLVAGGFCRKQGYGKTARWRLVKDPVKMPRVRRRRTD